VVRLASGKVKAAESWFVERGKPVPPILGADTCVVIDKEILGKPGSRREAACMLHKLSGRMHQVYTGIALASGPTTQTQTVMSEVTFTQLTSVQIDNYCASTEPYDKAGAYAIQGVGATLISHISGSYSNIMGLPLHETYALLTKARLVPVIK
jgi:septum formation protein